MGLCKSCTRRLDIWSNYCAVCGCYQDHYKPKQPKKANRGKSKNSFFKFLKINLS